MSETKIPGMAARHVIITPACRRSPDSLAAFERASERCYRSYLDLMDGHGIPGEWTAHLVLTIEPAPASPESEEPKP